MIYGCKQGSKQANIHIHMHNAVPLVCDSLRLAQSTLDLTTHIWVALTPVKCNHAVVLVVQVRNI